VGLDLKSVSVDVERGRAYRRARWPASGCTIIAGRATLADLPRRLMVDPSAYLHGKLSDGSARITVPESYLAPAKAPALRITMTVVPNP
jgi:hypothetical protein